MKYIRMLGILMVLLVILSAPAYAATAKPALAVVSGSVNVFPGTLMAGDSGTVTITVMNTLKSAGVGDTHQQTDSFSYGASESNGQAVAPHTTTITTSGSDATYANAYLKTVSLGNDGPIRVDPKQPPGTVLGMGDSITYTFTFKVDANAQDGLYQLLFRITTDDDGVYLNYLVPVRVDNTPLKLYVNDAPKAFGLSQKGVTLDLVNNRANEVNSVSIVPSGDGYTFKPMQEYIVGTIGAGEMYTAQIDVASVNATNGNNPQFKAVYKNGDNWHESAPAIVYVDNSGIAASAAGSDNSIFYVIGIIVVALIVIGGLFWFLRGKRAKQ